MSMERTSVSESFMPAAASWMMPDANSPIPLSSFPEVLSVMVNVVKFCGGGMGA
jgi:hypothetical protein